MESSQINPIINVHNPTGGCRLVRSPSRDSLATQASLGSVLDSGHGANGQLRVSFRAKSECETGGSRGPSPLPSHRLSVPQARPRPRSQPWLDEGNDLIRSCGALSKVLGLQRSFSCGDIMTGLETLHQLHHSRSDSWLVQAEDYAWGRLEASSRSLSTWVAVGDVEEINSQLPSPHVEMSKVSPPASSLPAAVGMFNQLTSKSYLRDFLSLASSAQLTSSGPSTRTFVTTTSGGD